MHKLGIEPESHALCEDNEIQPGLKPERQALLENIDCLRRLLTQFLPHVLEAYCKLNEFFERKPLSDRVAENLQEYLVVSRFKIIEINALLRADHFLAKQIVDPPKPKVIKEEPSVTSHKKSNYFQLKLEKSL